MPAEIQQATGWRIGPPSPILSWATRGLQAATLLVVMIWVFGFLGGTRFTPRPLPDTAGGVTANDTSALFNLHPISMTLAFVVIMGEALLAYRSPLLTTSDRGQRKRLHIALHAAAAVVASLGLTAAFLSHTLKRPTPIPNLYSVHSYVGISVFSLFVAQCMVGVSAYCYPRWHLAHRAALGPVHAFVGMAVFVGGAAAVVTGAQEKATFVQLLASPASVYGGAMLALLALLTVAATLYHHALPATRQGQWQVGEDEGCPASSAAPYDVEPLHLGRLG